MSTQSTISLRTLTDALIEEHGGLRRALDLLGRYAQRVLSGDEFEPRTAREFVRFFRGFGDRRHHEQEERLLFAWLEEHGFAPDSGALAVLRSERAHARTLLQEFERTVGALLRSPGKHALHLRLHGQALRYAELLTAHMNKEELVLFPLALRIAERNGAVVRCGRRAPSRAAADIAALEAAVDESWPQATLSLHGLGTPKEFQRLCLESLVGEDAERERNSMPTPRARTPATGRPVTRRSRRPEDPGRRSA